MSEKIRSFAQDYKIGTTNENPVFEIINQYWPDDEIQKSKSKTARTDYYGKENNYELKTIFTDLSGLSHWMIPHSKIQASGNKPLIVLYSYRGKLLYYRYTDETFSVHSSTIGSDKKPLVYVNKFCRKPRPDFVSKPEDYLYINKDLFAEI